MKRTPLPELIERIGQSAVARELDVSAPAIAKAIKSGRVIFVIENEDGTMSGEEVRPFPSQSVAQRSTA
ncbi:MULTISPECIES: Cro/CI family transcriptional regulator [Pseudomonas]|uniref:Cro/CI family transcriptional regulator n=1 Tax=Pseudomonas TaxID=286 RepID=UPI0006D3EF28|nr:MULTISPECIES: Cro/CI family transcriptional regulator [Pseudomonas]OCT28242.1 Cro/Cl family transcriptional regulator [Pseudomonas putida]OCT31806.1 Cro/Cl family transcriptional regulator [Pseudomonas putida]OCT41584.1 Cro/Cl family transcriptional regulator [Pseudomonas putida]